MAAGMGQTFFVFQAQRDLALARTAEILAISDYNKSLVDLTVLTAETNALVSSRGAAAQPPRHNATANPTR